MDSSSEETSEEESEEDLSCSFEVLENYEVADKMEGTALTEDEMAGILAFLNKEENNGFMMSSYKTPADIDWGLVFYNGADLSNCNYSDAALAAYLDAIGESSVEFDLIALSGKDIRAFAEAKTGITDFDMSRVGGVYIESEDVVFWQVSDYNYCEAYECIRGVRSGNKVQIDIHWGRDHDIRMVLTETGDSSNPYQFCTNRELWEKDADYIASVKDYETCKTRICTVNESKNGIAVVEVIEDDAVLVIARPGYWAKGAYDEITDIAFSDVDEDGFFEIVVVLTDGKKSAVAVCETYVDDWGNFGISYGREETSNWLVENVSALTAKNAIDYIKDHLDEYQEL